MSGFQAAQWSDAPRGKGRHRKARTLWFTVKRATGTPPTLLEYLPPQRWLVHPDGKREWCPTARWVVHHEQRIYQFIGGADHITDEIAINGLDDAAQSIEEEQDGVDNGDSQN